MVYFFRGSKRVAPADSQSRKRKLSASVSSLFEQANGLGPRARLHKTFERGRSSSLATAIAILRVLCVTVSVMLNVVESDVSLYMNGYDEHFFIADSVCIVFLTFDVAVRTLSAPSPLRYSCEFLNFMDIVSLLPYYITAGFKAANSEIMGSLDALVVLRMFRLLLVVKFLKAGKYTASFRLLVSSVSASKSALGILVFLLIILGIVSGTAIFYSERGTLGTGENGNWTCVYPMWNAVNQTYTNIGVECVFQDIFHGMYLAAVTITTVGYGDHNILWKAPAPSMSPLGQVIACGMIISGLIVVSLPISAVGTTLTSKWDEYSRRQEMKRLRVAEAHKMSSKALVDAGPSDDVIDEAVSVLEEGLGGLVQNGDSRRWYEEFEGLLNSLDQSVMHKCRVLREQQAVLLSIERSLATQRAELAFLWLLLDTVVHSNVQIETKLQRGAIRLYRKKLIKLTTKTLSLLKGEVAARRSSTNLGSLRSLTRQIRTIEDRTKVAPLDFSIPQEDAQQEVPSSNVSSAAPEGD